MQTSITTQVPSFPPRLTTLRRDIAAGMAAACSTVPISMSAGVLVYAPLGADHLARGAVAGLYQAVIAGIVAGLIASSSFIVTAPAASISIVLAAVVGPIVAAPAFSGHLQWMILAIALCALAAAILQVLFGVLNIGRIIKFTPHPVIAGFVNSVAMLIALSQLRPFFGFAAGATGDHWGSINRPTMLVFVLMLSIFMILFGNWTKKIPAPVAGLVVGSALFYLLESAFPHLNIGPTIGALPVTLASLVPLSDIADSRAWSAMISIAPHLLLTALILGTVGTLQALLSFRSMQTLADLPPRPPRDLVAQGAANIAGALTAGLFSYPVPPTSALCFRAGGRTRLAGISCAVSVLLVILLFPSVLARVPVAVLAAILVAIAVQFVDRWSLRLLADVIRNAPGLDRRQALQSLSIVAIVMLVTVASSIVAGALAGFVLACLIFIARMSRPIVRRRYGGDGVFSKRVHSAADTDILRRTGARRVVLELQGVLFFGNADDLSSIMAELMVDHDMILLDLRGISDIDVSGVTILANAVGRCRARGKEVLFCNLPAARPDLAAATGKASAVLADLDSALEWMEEEALRSVAPARPRNEAIPLAELDLFRALDGGERSTVQALLVARDFPAGAAMCREGDEADRMWILTNGSVSVRLNAAAQSERRISSMAAGTTVGEMGLLEGNRRRSATVVCDEDVSSYELDRPAFETILRDHPQIARKLFSYFTRDLVQRLRMLHEDLRTLSG